jgi:hypothetical protein
VFPRIPATEPLFQHDTNCIYHYPSDCSNRNGLRLFFSAAALSRNPYNLSDKAPDTNTMSCLSANANCDLNTFFALTDTQRVTLVIRAKTHIGLHAKRSLKQSGLDDNHNGSTTLRKVLHNIQRKKCSDYPVVCVQTDGRTARFSSPVRRGATDSK